MRTFYFGWYIVAVAMVANFILVGISFSSYGLFVIPVARDLGLSRADMNTGLVLMNIGAAVAAPLLGKLLDRIPLKPMILASIPVYGGCLITLANSSSIWIDAAILLLGLPSASLIFALLTPDMLLARWFKAHRARAMSLSMLGWPLGTIIVPPLVSLLIRERDWRFALATVGVGMVLLMLPLNLLVRERPGVSDIEPAKAAHLPPTDQVASVSGSPMTIRKLLGSMRFCGNVLAFALASACMQACQVSLVPLAVHAGFSDMSATSLVSLNGCGALMGILAISVIADRFSRAAMLLVITAILAMMTGTLLFSRYYTVLAVASFLLGLGNAFPAVLYTLLIDRFGRASFGTMLGLVMPALTACCAAAYLFSGAAFDATGNYNLMLYTFAAVQILAIALFYFVNYGRQGIGCGVRSVISGTP